jgi:cell division transport system permease protein
MGRISFFLKEAFGSLKRNYFMTIAALVTVFLSILVLGGVLVFVFTTDALLGQVEKKVEITVYFKTKPAEPSSDQMTALQTEILSWPEVKTCEFVSKEEALKRIKEWYADRPEIWENLTSNPLPASLGISLVDPQSAAQVKTQIEEQDPGNKIIDEVKFGQEIADKLFTFTSGARNFMLIFIVLLGVVAILLISNTIRLSIFARKREVEIMKLVGATNWFIRWPFLIEGVTVGFFGALLAAVTLLLLNNYLAGKLRDSILFLNIPLDAVPFIFVTLVLLGVGVVIGALGSAIGLRRFLKI